MSSSHRLSQSLSARRLVVSTLAIFAAVTLVQAALSPGLVRRFYPLPEDQGATWYFWQLGSTTTLGRLSFWTGYIAHQVVVVLLLLRGRNLPKSEKESRKFTQIMIGVNVAFVSLHLLQTQLWYDGLARDVPIWTSQGSVIGMLVLVLFLEMPRRGLFFGLMRKVPKRMYAFVRRWHGLYISWAVIYTFWFHPMEGNWGLLSGFIYMYLLFVQLSISRTRQHLSPGWIVLLESGVIIHALLITIYKHNPIWPMFLLGFVAMFSFTQVYAFRKRALEIAAFVLYVASAAIIYGLVRGFDLIFELTFIPVALYGGVIALLLLGYFVEYFANRWMRSIQT